MYLSGFSNKRRNASSCSGVVAAVAVAVSSSKAAPLATGIKCATHAHSVGLGGLVDGRIGPGGILEIGELPSRDL